MRLNRISYLPLLQNLVDFPRTRNLKEQLAHVATEREGELLYSKRENMSGEGQETGLLNPLLASSQ
jgi:predicted RNA-binding protein with EMAP domain